MKKVSTFSQRLADAIHSSERTQTDVARDAGVSKSSITRYLKGDWEAKQDILYALAKVLNVSEAWLMGMDVPKERTTPVYHIPAGFDPLPEMVKAPLVGSIACGQPILADTNIEDYLDVPAGRGIDFCLTCRGDSMVDAGIIDGDIVYIRSQPDVENGEIAAVRIGTEATLKRVYKSPSGIVLAPANARYQPIMYGPGTLDEIRIEGKAVGWTHWV